MAEAIVFGMAGNILSDLSSRAVQMIASAVGVKQELTKLELALTSINAVLLDADELQLINNHELKVWVKRIKDACYEAEDVLDDFTTEALRRDLKIRDSAFEKVREFAHSIKSASFRFKMSRRIKEITKILDEIAADKSKYHLTKKPTVDKGTQNTLREHTHSFVDESKVFGRTDDKNKIVKLLSDGDKKAIAIVGIGGLGKTTLAQLVYRDKRTDGVFDMKMWVGVYQDFDDKKILKNIIKSATNNECPDLEMDQLRSCFEELVKGKKFLLVLDDVWNEVSGKWDNLKFVMSSGAAGSKLVITTRKKKVASVMGAEPYSLKKISSDDCWNVFKQRAFETVEGQPDADMVVIGKEIVGRCDGVPLAAKTLGSLMCFKKTQREWEIVRDSDVWRLPQNENDIMPALRLSYNDLPIHLKQCFAYLAWREMDSLYGKNGVIHSWIAHGFVRLSPGDGSSLEDAGNDYVKQLLWRSLIQEPEHDNCGNLISFKVHDLIHNLATSVLGTEFTRFEGRTKVLKPEEIRYAELRKCPDSDIEEVLYSMPNLRELGVKCDFPAADIFSRLKCLRLLRMEITNELFPSSIGKLKHLRGLAIFSGATETLPTSVTKLLNLQTFDLSGCPKLRALPEDMGKMINLRHVALAEGAPMSHMPLGFKNLTSLRTLTVFFVSKGVGSKLNELGGLIHLEGQLTIKNLENVSDPRDDCAEANLKAKKRLESLKFSWTDREGDEKDVSKERNHVDVLENLQPHSDLKILEIEGYMGSRFASWMMMTKPYFSKMVKVSLVKCRNAENLPPFGELPLLGDLLLKDMDALKFVEDRGGNVPMEWFPCLKKLRLENLSNLESFRLEEKSKALPSLVELTISGCPRLENMPLLPSLERLEVNRCSEKLVQSLLMLPDEKASSSSSSPTRLKCLKIKECDDLISLPENWVRVLVSLEELVIENCSRLASLEDEGFFADSELVITSLVMSKLPNLVSLPQWIQKSTKLQTLEIVICHGLIDVPAWIWKLTSLRTLGITYCEKLKWLPDGMQSLTALEDLRIGSCDSLMRWPNGLRSLVSLKHLLIGCTSALPSLPEELQQLTALRTLFIFNCETISVLLNFTSLQQFTLFNCKNLQCLPDWFPNVTAIDRLYILDCDELTSRCQKGTGVDWPRIAHIPNIKLNLKWIQGSA